MLRIIVCVKQVPDPDKVNDLAQGSFLKINAETHDPVTEHIPWVMNGYDEQAMTAAVAIRNAAGQGEIVVLSVGCPQPKALFKRAFELGGDRGYHIESGIAGCNLMGTALLLAGAIRHLGGADLVLCGRQHSDDDQASLGPLVAASLDLACLTAVRNLRVLASGTIQAERTAADGDELLEAALPAVATLNDDFWVAPMPKAAHILAARKKEAVPLTPDAIGMSAGEVRRLQQAMKRVAMTVPERRGACAMIAGDTLADIAVRLARQLRADGLI